MKEQRGKRCHKKQKTENNLEKPCQNQNVTSTHIQTTYHTNNVNIDHIAPNPTKNTLNKTQTVSSNTNLNIDLRYDDTNGAGCSFWPSQNLEKDDSIWSQGTTTDNTHNEENTTPITHTHPNTQGEMQNTPQNENT